MTKQKRDGFSTCLVGYNDRRFSPFFIPGVFHKKGLEKRTSESDQEWANPNLSGARRFPGAYATRKNRQISLKMVNPDQEMMMDFTTERQLAATSMLISRLEEKS